MQDLFRRVLCRLQPHKIRRRVRQPLQLTLTELVVVTVAVTTLAVWWPTYLNTGAAVGQLAGRYTESVARETVERTRAHLAAAPPALELCRGLLLGDPRYGVEPPLPATAPEVWRSRARLCLEVMNAHPGFDMVYYGDESGVWTGVERIEGQLLVDHRWIEGSRHRRLVFRVDAGRWLPAPDLERSADPLIRTYDPRERPWYRQARRAGRPIWTKPYVFAAPGNPPGITAALPIRRASGAGGLAGVLAVDFKLQELNRFLERIRHPGPEVFLLAPEGAGTTFRVVAEPEGALTAGRTAPGDLKLPEAGRSANPVLRGAAAELTRGTVAAGEALRFHAGRTPYLGALYPCTVGPDLEWTVLVAVPEREVLGVIQANTLWSSLLGVGIALLGAAFGAILSATVARPLRLFAREMRQVGDLQISSAASPESFIHEIHEMGRVLDRMKAGLRAFQKYLPTDVVELHVKKGEEAALGGETARVTLMFADIVGFTSVSEHMEPAELVDALAAYLDVMEAVVSRHEGLVDKYVGDCIIAFWGTPLRPHDQPERAACNAALELQERFDSLNSSGEAEGRPPFELRIGIHAGEALVGNIGSQRRMGYTAMGDSVNLASRLEGLTREYGARILISETVQAVVAGEFETRFIDEVAVRGRTARIRIYELLRQL